MCNDYGNNIPYTAYLEAFSQTQIPVRFPSAAPNLEPRDDIWPTDTAPVIRQVEDGFEFAQLRWGFPPGRPKAAPVINFRSEGRRFPTGRCLVPASHFFEFTGTKSPKAKWRFTKTGEDWFCFAGLWRPMPDGAGDAFTLLTTEPGPDVAPIHNRQMVVLERADWKAWLALEGPRGGTAAPPPGRQSRRRAGKVTFRRVEDRGVDRAPDPALQLLHETDEQGPGGRRAGCLCLGPRLSPPASSTISRSADEMDWGQVREGRAVIQRADHLSLRQRASATCAAMS